MGSHRQDITTYPLDMWQRQFAVGDCSMGVTRACMSSACAHDLQCPSNKLPHAVMTTTACVAVSCHRVCTVTAGMDVTIKAHKVVPALHHMYMHR